MQLTIGCDPELFLFDNVEQKIVPAMGKIGGSKNKPLSLKCGGMVQLDGTVLEFGTKPVSVDDPCNFPNAIQEAITEIREKLYGRFKGRYDLRCGALASYEGDYDYGTALDVGCSPQYTLSHDRVVALPSADTLDPSAIPVGGHIHLGFGCDMDTTDPALIQSVRSHITHFHLSGVQSRRDLQRTNTMNIGGTALRIKPYGYEYRNLSSMWLANKSIARDLAILHRNIGVYLRPDRIGPAPRGARVMILDKLAKLARTSNKLHDTKYQGTLPLDY